jgi:hypothetical protein
MVCISELYFEIHKVQKFRLEKCHNPILFCDSYAITNTF